MEVLNRVLIRQFRGRSIIIKYMRSSSLSDLQKLKSILREAYPDSADTPTGTANYYFGSRHGHTWNGTDDPDTSLEGQFSIVSIDDFFQPSEISINYQIY